MKYAIGRGSDQYKSNEGIFRKLIVPNIENAQGVAANHALLNIEHGIATITPVGKESVFVNDFEVKIKKLKPLHLIRLGKNYQFYLHYFFKLKSGRVVSERKSFDFSEEFMALQSVWTDYLKTEKKLKKKEQVFANLSRLPYFIGSVFSPLFAKDQEEKVQKAIRQHQQSSLCVCPMCKLPLAGKSWEEWKADSGHSCGANW